MPAIPYGADQEVGGVAVGFAPYRTVASRCASEPVRAGCVETAENDPFEKEAYSSREPPNGSPPPIVPKTSDPAQRRSNEAARQEKTRVIRGEKHPGPRHEAGDERFLIEVNGMDCPAGPKQKRVAPDGAFGTRENEKGGGAKTGATNHVPTKRNFQLTAEEIHQT